MKNSNITHIKDFFQFLIIYIIYVILLFLPIYFTSNIGGLIFRFIGPFTKVHKIVKKNFKIIFPNADNNKVKKQATLSWFKAGKTLFELLVLHNIMETKDKISIIGQENLKDVINNREKVIFIGIHQSNWEILLPSIDKLGIPAVGIYRHINNPFIDKLILKIREKSLSNHSSYTPKGKKSAKDIIEGVRKDTSMVLLVDQKDSAGELVNFFGVQTKTQIGFIKIAKKYNLRIIPVENIRNKNDSFTLKFYKPIKIISKDISDNIVMKDIHSIIELWIKKNPSDWLLQHNRFS